MGFFLLGLYKVLVLEAVALLALLDARWRPARRRLVAYLALAGLVWLAFFNFGSIHGRGQLPHWAEQFHFDLGDKYLCELHYDGLYPATFAALADRGLPAPPVLRDTTTFETVPPAEIPNLAKRAKRRFSPARWAQFQDDLFSLLSEQPSAASTGDHGNTASPAGALVPWALLALVPLHGIGFRILACADLVILAAAFLAVWRWGSARVAVAAFALALLAPYATDFLVGSLFRFDWLVACLGGTLALWRGQRALAGALLAYAALSRPFALAFGLCALAGLLGDVWRRAADRRALARFTLGAIGCGAALVVVSSLAFGASIWPDYLVRMIATMREGYYGLSHGFRNVYEQIAIDGPIAIVRPIPDFVAAARPGAFQGMGLRVAQAALGLLVLAACVRDGAVMGTGLGVLLAFATVVTNAYYQGMWGVLALACALHAPSSGRARAGLALACLVIASRYVIQHAGDLRYAHDYFGNWTTFAFALVWCVAALLGPPLRAPTPSSRVA